MPERLPPCTWLQVEDLGPSRTYEEMNRWAVFLHERGRRQVVRFVMPRQSDKFDAITHAARLLRQGRGEPG